MNVARRNRSWTPELKAKLYSEVAQITADGTTRSAAFQQLSNQYGVTAGQLSNVYYIYVNKRKQGEAAKQVGKRGRVGATMGFLAPSAGGVAVKRGRKVTATSPDIADAITLLKKMGANVTISF